MHEHTEHVAIDLDLDLLEPVKAALAHSPSAKIGVLGKNGDAGSAAFIASCHEFGANPRVTERMRAWFFRHFGVRLKASTTHIHIPERSFLRLAMHFRAREFQEFINGQAGNLFESIMSGNWRQSIDRMGAKWAAFVQEAFETRGFGTWPGLSDITKSKRKAGSDVPLQDTGAMRRSITHEVSDGPT